jgi:purine-nucleoside phosphorylase
MRNKLMTNAQTTNDYREVIKFGGTYSGFRKGKNKDGK